MWAAGRLLRPRGRHARHVSDHLLQLAMITAMEARPATRRVCPRRKSEGAAGIKPMTAADVTNSTIVANMKATYKRRRLLSGKPDGHVSPRSSCRSKTGAGRRAVLSSLGQGDELPARRRS